MHNDKIYAGRITSINKVDVSESSKTSTSAGNQGRFSNSVIDEIVLKLMIYIAKKDLDSRT